MKAVRIHVFGDFDKLRSEDLPIPEPGPGEVRIRVMAASVNPVDYKILHGKFLQPDALPATLGRDVAGVVEKLGPGVSDPQVGDEVYALLGQDHGGFVEFVAEKADLCAYKPASLDFVEAAATPLAGLTAWQGLFDQGRLQPGQRVLIHGAAGGVGHLAVQFARARGCEVVATCSGEDVEFVEGLGAAVVIDYHKQRFEDLAGEVDLVFDLIGGDVQTRSWTVLKDGGALVSTLQQPDQARAQAKGARAIVYMAQGSGGELAEIARLTDDDEVTPEVARVFPLDEVAEAERTLETQHVRGKIVLEVAA
jgi:NADPH:quinone reductase-like Zn-dependent oxidoreductase